MKLYYFPLSSYSQKTVMAFHEKQVGFEPELVNLFVPGGRDAYLKVNAFGKLPTLVLDDGRIIPESSIIIEYLDSHFPSGTRLIPADTELARQARFYDRVADHYLNDPMQKVFFDARKPESDQDPKGVAAAKKTLDTCYQLLDRQLEHSTWLAGESFTMADCAAAPSLSYLRMVYPYEQYKNLSHYANRVCERPSFQKVLAEARPFMAAMMGG